MEDRPKPQPCKEPKCEWLAPPGQDYCGYHYAVYEQKEREIQDAEIARLSKESS